MAEQFYTILTNTGKAKIANSLPTGQKVNLTKMKIGDSNGTYYNPSENQTELVHKVYECNVTSVEVDEINPSWITITAAIPSDVGGFSIREVGIFDDSNSLIAIGKYPETYKPVASDGSTKELYIKMTLEVTNAASVELKIDPTVVLATKKDISNLDAKIEQNSSQLNESVQQIVNSNGYGVISGLNVSAQNNPDMSVNISSGVVLLKDGSRKNITTKTISIPPSNTVRPRKDLIVINSDGNIEHLIGELGNNAIQGKMTYTIVKNAVAEDIIIMQGHRFRCVNNNATGNQFNVGSDTSETASNFAKTLNSHDIISKFFNVTSDANVITIAEKVIGGGNTPDKSQNNGSMLPPTTTMVISDGIRTVSSPIVAIPPIIPEGSIPLAEILILPNKSTIENADITDKRLIIESNKDLTLKTNDYINVKSFGAKGDGVNDDSEAIQTAINSGNNIYFPNGTYFITKSLRYNKDNLKLFGNNATIIGQCYGLLNSPDYDEIGNKPLLKNIVIEGLTFKRKDLYFDEIDKILFIRHVDGFTIKNCKFVGWNGDAIGIDLLYGSDNLYSPLVPKNITIENNIFDGVDNNDSQAIFILQGMKITIKNNLFINTSRNGMPGSIDIEPWQCHPSLVMIQDIDILDNTFENIRGSGGVINFCLGNGNNQNNLTYPIKNIRIKGNKFSDCYGMFVYINQRGNRDSSYWESNNVEITDNTFNGSQKNYWQTMCIHGMNNVVIKNNVFNHLHGRAYFGDTQGLEYVEPKNIDLVFSNNIINDFAPFEKYAGVLFEIGLNDGLTIDSNYFVSDDSLYRDYTHIYLFRQTVKTAGTKMINYVFRNNICYDRQSSRTFTLLQDVKNNNASETKMIGNILGGTIKEYNTVQE